MNIILFIICAYFAWSQFKKIESPDKYGGGGWDGGGWLYTKLFGNYYKRPSHALFAIIGFIFAIFFLVEMIKGNWDSMGVFDGFVFFKVY
jgi:uncharacterized membrane protein